MNLRGTVLWYEPRQARGIIRSQCGREFLFVQADDSLALEGGDVVEFSISAEDGDGRNADRWAQEVRLVQRCIDDLVAHHAPLVELFHETVSLPSTPSTGEAATASFGKAR